MLVHIVCFTLDKGYGVYKHLFYADYVIYIFYIIVTMDYIVYSLGSGAWSSQNCLLNLGLSFN
jgi:hypothetical protein